MWVACCCGCGSVARADRLLGFLGELMLRLLKMLVLPLVAGSMVAGEHPEQNLNALKRVRLTISHILT